MVDILVPNKDVKSDDPAYEDRQDNQYATNMVDYVERTWGQWRQYYDAEFLRAFDLFRFFMGVDYGQWDPAAVDRMKREERFILTFNISGQKIEGLWSSTLKIDYDTDFLPIETGRSNLLSIMKELKNRDKELLNYDQSSAMLRLYGLIAQGVEGIYIERNAPADPLGYVGRRVYLPWHVLFCPYWLTNNIRDNPETLIAAYLTAEELRDQYQAESDEIDHAIRIKKDEGYKPLEAQSVAPYKDGSGAYGDKYRVIERHFLERKPIEIYYDPISGLTLPQEGDESYIRDWIAKNGYNRDMEIRKKDFAWIHRVMATCGELLPKQLLCDGMSEIQLGHMLPYRPWSAMRLNGKWRSALDMGVDANKLVNKSKSLLADIARSSASNTILYKNDLFDNEEDKQTFIQRINKAGQKIPVSGAITGRIDEYLYNVNQNQTNHGLTTEFMNMMDMMDRVMKVPAAQESRTESASESGVLFRAKFQAAQIQAFALQESLRQHENDMTEMWFLQAQRQYAQFPREIILKGGKVITINTSEDTDISMVPRAKVIISESKDSDLTRGYEREMYMDYLKTIPGNMPTLQVLASSEAAKRFEMKEEDRDKAMQAIDLDMKVAIGQQQLKLLQIEKAIQAEQNPQPPAQQTKPPSVAIHYADLPPEGQQQAAAQAGIQISPQQAQQKQAFDSAQVGPQGPLGQQQAPGTQRQELTMQPQKQNINTNEARQSPLSTPVI